MPTGSALMEIRGQTDTLSFDEQIQRLKDAISEHSQLTVTYQELPANLKSL